ncbi:putative ubiquitin D [Rhizophagus irregularis]|uniref:Ubiquitin n=3 Tax=Rhizophagus irregularis TaxID=588596 RepID=A0A015LKQ8_RHIIW|nr:putative ubiquitin D [Rhizophagus irregularis DAOM 181602=DAOM 197198]EXX55373.1 ubiquitin [Rhizophagus irregularis DAOM 197198w]PKB94025.1 putative ubiquitin D [Rhizophagus irregularis]PKK63885.1 putative ubiquitin D [Rhizophagus irregularis]PKY20420.1 putative ubiquitin D [Rhizophagus irregularis]POG81775.1 putative ubiquitin D [Rhizophagus irregularis DAOM 181602=DAOM 197198]|eukprot:XP_025188641.1 putative ubiquitin D [Rhizophagus irregularis DAOM 181602=DAOM 197198]
MRVKIRAFGFKFKIDVDSCDKIKQVKHKIKEAHGPDVDEQELYLGGLRLENEKTVSDYKIEENGEIKLLRIVVGGFQICIKNIRGKEITLQVRSTYTIKKVKELIFEKEGMEVDTQRLIFNGIDLLNDNLLSSYGIVKGNTLHLVSRLHGGSHLSV